MAVIKSEYLLPNYDPEEVGIKGEKGDDGKTSYVHIAYSNSSDGGVDFSTTDPTNRAYTGYYTDFELTDSTDPSKYEWQRTKGDSGKDGVAGKDGVGLRSTSVTYAKHTNASTPPSTGWQEQVPTVPAGQYLWTKTVWTYTDNSSETGYSVARMGADGTKGNDGIAGKDGVGIKTTVIEYAISTSGTVRPTTNWSTTIPNTPAGQYLWTRTTWTYTDNTTEQGFTVARQGEKGDKGDQGIAGPTGEDGRTPYFHTAYAWSADGTDRFTNVYPGENLIKYSKFTSNTPLWYFTSSSSEATRGKSDGYFWIEDYDATERRWKQWQITFNDTNEQKESFLKFIASQNKNAALSFNALVKDEISVEPRLIEASVRDNTGRDIANFRISSESLSEEFQRFSIQFKIPEDAGNITKFRVILTYHGFGHCEFSKPKLEFEEYTIYTPAPSEDPLNAYPTYTGTYTDYTEADSTNPADYTWVRILGEAGHDGVGISTTIIEYNKSTNSTTPPSSGWTSTIPSISGGQYLWTRTTLNYTDGKKAESYTVARQGEDGSDGQLFTGETEPTDFNEGDIWYKVVSGKVTGVYEAKAGTWVEIPFESSVIAKTIIGKTIQASHLTGSTIDGGKISGAEFQNEYENVTSGANQVTDGKLGIKDGILQAGASYYLTNSSGERLYKFATTEADIHQGTVNLRQRMYDESGTLTSESTTGVSGGLITLSLSDASGKYNGVLDAKALTKTPWINLPLNSNFEVKENNAPAYRIVYQLDGTRKIEFKGQVGPKPSSGISIGKDSSYYPFQSGTGTSFTGDTYVPSVITPEQTEFAYSATNKGSGGRVAITTTPKIIFIPAETLGQATEAGKAPYFSLSSLSYTLH